MKDYHDAVNHIMNSLLLDIALYQLADYGYQISRDRSDDMQVVTLDKMFNGPPRIVDVFWVDWFDGEELNSVELDNTDIYVGYSLVDE